MGIVDRFRSSIRYPIVMALVLVTVVPVMVVGLILASRNRDYLTTLEKQYLTRQAVDLAAEVRMFFAAHRARLAGAAAAIRVAEGAAPLLDDESLRKIAAQDEALVQLQLVDARGRGPFARRGTVDADTAKRFKERLERARKKVLEDGKPVEAIIEGSGKRTVYWLVALPLPGPGETPAGVLEGVFDFGPIISRLHDESLRGLTVSIVDREGKAVLTSVPDLLGRSLASVGPVADFLKLPVRLTKVYPNPAISPDAPVLGSVAPVDGMGWAVLVERPTTEAFAAVRGMQRSTLLLSLLAAVIGLGVGLAVSRALTRPIERLAAVSSKLADGDLSVRAKIPGQNEIARLAANFDHMAGSVEALVRRLKQALRQNQELFLETIRTLAAAVDAKDPYTRGHSERVSSYSMAIAKHLGMGPEAVFRIRIAAILHDVGKLGVRDDVLKKPGKLTPEEFEEMKRHPEIGAQIMEPIRLLRDIIPGIRNHHERWDGTGYPDGLRGESIPMMARIIAVADTFDAMTTDRPYQRALSLDYVLAKMREMTGTRYDARVVDALIEAVRRGDITPPAMAEVS